MANFNITVSYKSGITNIIADALTRVHEDHNQLDDAAGIHMRCREISKPRSTITSSIINEIMLDGSTESMPMMDAIMISDLEMKQDVPIPYRLAVCKASERIRTGLLYKRKTLIYKWLSKW